MGEPYFKNIQRSMDKGWGEGVYYKMKPLKTYIEGQLLLYLKPKQAERIAQSIMDKLMFEFRHDVIEKIQGMTKEEMRKVLDGDNNVGSGDATSISS